MRSHSSVVVLCVVVLLTASYGFRWWKSIPHETPQHRHQVEEIPTTSGTMVPKAEGELTKFGEPAAHRIVGPFHILRNQGYVSGYDAGIQDPRWVETRFFAVNSPTSAGRPGEFSPDYRIESEYQVTTHCWTGTGYDRGHMAPNWGVSICYGRSAQIETFLLTNVIPQSPELNRGLWETLEKIISNDYAERFGQVWVICGPIFASNPATLKDGKIAIPERCYKIVLRMSEGGPHVLAFEMPQALPMGHRQSDLLQYMTSVSQVEKDTEITFFPDLAEPQRQIVEEEKPAAMW